MRDKNTGVSKGYAFLCYYDQRSTVLAVDNLNNAEVCGQTIRVDHMKKYKPNKELLDMLDKKDPKITEEMLYTPSGNDGLGWGRYRKLKSQEQQMLDRIRQDETQKNKYKQDLLIKMQYDDGNGNTKKVNDSSTTLLKREQLGNVNKQSKLMLDEDEKWDKILMHGLKEGDMKHQEAKTAKRNESKEKSKKSKHKKHKNKSKNKLHNNHNSDDLEQNLKKAKIQ